MKQSTNRRDFLRNVGIGATVAPFAMNLSSLGFANNQGMRKQRMVVIFSPNGIVPNAFWPNEQGADFKLKEILSPLKPYQKKTLVLHGVCDKVRGDGDSHMRGIGCLLTGSELYPGNIQGGSHTPAGWASGHSIDQEIKRFLQGKKETRTRFGSLEFGALVPDRADTWTRMVYAGPNKPIAPIDDPYQMFQKLYGQMKNQRALASVLDSVQQDLHKLKTVVSREDQKHLDEHATFVRDMESQLKAADDQDRKHIVPKLEQGVKDENDNLPRISKMQIDLMVNSFVNDFTRIATMQYTNSVGQAKMNWLGFSDGHHSLSHKPDKDKPAQEKLVKINKWYCQQMAYLVKRLDETKEPGGQGTLLDNTTVIWTNELGKGNSHTLNDIPFVMVGGGLNFKMGQSLKLKSVAHHRLLLALAHGFGHRLETFGNKNYCGGGPLGLI
jgi:hypothetical protein